MPDKTVLTCPGKLPAGWTRVVLGRSLTYAKRQKPGREYLATNLFLFGMYKPRVRDGFRSDEESPIAGVAQLREFLE